MISLFLGESATVSAPGKQQTRCKRSGKSDFSFLVVVFFCAPDHRLGSDRTKGARRGPSFSEKKQRLDAQFPGAPGLRLKEQNCKRNAVVHSVSLTEDETPGHGTEEKRRRLIIACAEFGCLASRRSFSFLVWKNDGS